MQMIKNYIEGLQTRHPHEKRQFALQVSAVITGAIFLIWFATLGPRILAQITPADETAAVGNADNSVFSSVASVGAAISGRWNQTKAMIASVGSGPSWDGATGTLPVSAPQSVGQAVNGAGSATVIAIPDTVQTDDASSGSN